MPESIRYLRHADVPRGSDDLVVRENRLSKAVFLIGFLAVGGGAYAAHLQFPASIPGFVAYLVTGSMALCALIAFGHVRASLYETNWLIRASDDGLFIHFRSYLNHNHPPDDISALFVPRRMVSWIRMDRRDVPIPDRDGGKSVARKPTGYLEIKLRDADTDRIETLLRQERTRRSRGRFGVSVTTRHYPVRLLPDRILQVSFGTGKSTRPRLAETVELLSRQYRVLLQKDQQHDPDPETQLISLAQGGDTISAIVLAKQLYGYDTTAAKKFVDELIDN